MQSHSVSSPTNGSETVGARRTSLTLRILSILVQFIIVAGVVAGLLHLMPQEFLGPKFPTWFATLKFAFHFNDLTAWIFLGVVALFAALSLYIAAMVSILAAAIYGIYKGSGIVFGGVLVGAIFAYLGRMVFGRKPEEGEAEKRVGFYAVLRSALGQFAPYASVVGGKSGPSLPSYVVATFLGTIPIALVCIATGLALGSVYRPDQLGTYKVMVPVGLLFLLPLAFRSLLPEKSSVPPIVVWGVIVLLFGGVVAGYYFVKIAPLSQVETVTEIAVQEFPNDRYPDDPETRSVHFGKFNGRKLVLKQHEDNKTHFDFVLEPLEGNDHIATITFKDIDASLYAVNAPKWTRDDPNLLRIALVDREWNRQQCQFYVQEFGDKKADGIVQIETTDTKNWEKNKLVVASLARNCLNAGLWEVILYTTEDGRKKMYYHGWFQFPMGHYAQLFEHNLNDGADEKQITYGLFPWDNRWQLEHWVDPTGTVLDGETLNKLRTFKDNDVKEVKVTFRGDEKIFAMGNQVGKHKNIMAHNLRHWSDFYDGRVVRFSTFIKPGMYQVDIPWNNDFWRMSQHPTTAILRKITPKAAEDDRYKDKTFFELELAFSSKYLEASSEEQADDDEENDEDGDDHFAAFEAMTEEQNYFEVLRQAGVKERLRFIISGFTLDPENTGEPLDVAKLPTHKYNQGFYRPMGIGVPPFYQDYTKLKDNPPQKEPYFSVLLDQNDRWIDHHVFGIDGPVMHRDEQDPTLLHLYMLSYERHTLIGHWTLKLPTEWVPVSRIQGEEDEPVDAGGEPKVEPEGVLPQAVRPKVGTSPVLKN